MTDAEIQRRIHELTAQDFLKAKDKIIYRHLKIHNLPEYWYDYLDYMLDPGNHNYDTLRKFLYHHSKFSLAPKMYKSVISYVKQNKLHDKIYKIIDVGCGHSGYWDMLKEIFPKARIIGIDKDQVPTILLEQGKFVKIDGRDHISAAVKYLSRSNIFVPDTLLFVSDMLHCKVSNINLLKEFENKYYILVNECFYDIFLDKRLRNFGGALIDSDIFCRNEYKVFFYSDTHYAALKLRGAR